MPPPRVLLIAKDYPPSIGGAEIYNAQMARALVQAGHSVTVATWTPDDFAEESTPPSRSDPRVVRLSRERLRGARPADRVPALLEEFAPDVAWVSPSSRHLTDVHERLVDRSIPIVATCHFFRSKHSRRGWLGRRRARARLHLDRVDAVVTVSRYLESQLVSVGIPEKQISIIPPGVDAHRFSPDPSRRSVARSDVAATNESVLLTVSRLVSGKGHDRVLEAMSILRERGCSLRYVVVGDGPNRGELEQQAQRLGLSERTRFVGQVDDPRPFYDAADVVVMPSGNDEWNEAFGISFVEAGAMEKPVVASRHSGAEDIVLDGRTGRLVDPRDPEAVAEAILSCVARHEEYGRAARAHVEAQFTWQRSAEKLSALFDDVRSRRGVRRG